MGTPEDARWAAGRGAAAGRVLYSRRVIGTVKAALAVASLETGPGSQESARPRISLKSVSFSLPEERGLPFPGGRWKGPLTGVPSGSILLSVKAGGTTFPRLENRRPAGLAAAQPS